jgi:Na+/melibiose symporter-like transporter
MNDIWIQRLGTFIPLPWQTIIPEWCVSNYRNPWTVNEYCSLFIGTEHSLWGITIMPLIKVYHNDSDPYGLKGYSIFKSVRPFIFRYVIVPKLHEWCLRRHVRVASAEAVSFCRTFGNEAWSQHHYNHLIEFILAKIKPFPSYHLSSYKVM